MNPNDLTQCYRDIALEYRKLCPSVLTVPKAARAIDNAISDTQCHRVDYMAGTKRVPIYRLIWAQTLGAEVYLSLASEARSSDGIRLTSGSQSLKQFNWVVMENYLIDPQFFADDLTVNRPNDTNGEGTYLWGFTIPEEVYETELTKPSNRGL